MPETEISRLARLEAHWEHISSGIEELKKGQSDLQRIIAEMNPKLVTGVDHVGILEKRQAECMTDCHTRIGRLEVWQSSIQGKAAIIGTGLIAIVSIVSSILTTFITRQFN